MEKMRIGIVACALGRHACDKRTERKVNGQRYARCRNCRTPMEMVGIEWQPIMLHNASFNHRKLN